MGSILGLLINPYIYIHIYLFIYNILPTPGQNYVSRTSFGLFGALG